MNPMAHVRRDEDRDTVAMTHRELLEAGVCAIAVIANLWALNRIIEALTK